MPQYPASPRCGAPSCAALALWRFAAALPDVASDVVLAGEHVEHRCTEHMTMAELTWLPGLTDGLVVVVGMVETADTLPGLADTVRMPSHLIDVDQLRPRRPRVPAIDWPTKPVARFDTVLMAAVQLPLGDES